MISDAVIYGKQKPIARHRIFLFEDLIDDHITTIDPYRIPRSPALEKLRAVYSWLMDNGIAEDDALLCRCCEKRFDSFNTSVRYYLHLGRDEHRALFNLTRENILNIEEPL
jgi:hypothetical protein